MLERDEEAAAPEAPDPGGEALRREVETVGLRLAERLTALLGGLPAWRRGPQGLAADLGVSPVTAGRLLRAIGQSEPVAIVRQVPGGEALRRIVDAALSLGVAPATADAAREAVVAFERLIARHGGSRGGFDALLTGWLPEAWREFESRRRQAAFKAISELRGISCELDLSLMAVAPGPDAPRADFLSIEGLLGLDRMRPDAVAHFGVLRRELDDAPSPPDRARRGPLTIEREPPLDGLHSIRLDEFCSAPPAPLASRRIGDEVQYTLGPTPLGPAGRIDLVIAELHPGELGDPTGGDSSGNSGRAPHGYFRIPPVPARRLLLDVLVHRDLYRTLAPRLRVYDISVRGPANPGALDREVDLLPVSERLVDLGDSPTRRRFGPFPRYLELVEHSFGRLGWDPADFRTYRIEVSYPLHGTQIGMVFLPRPEGK